MQNVKSPRRSTVLIPLLLLILACNLPQAPALLPVTPRPSETFPNPTPFPALLSTPTHPVPLYQPVFEAAPCAFPIPGGYSPECGYLVVPENRSNPGNRSIRLHVAIFHSSVPQPATDPVVHLSGGPGSSSLALANYLFRRGIGAVLQQRDLILFDQRGTGYSQPRLDCPERNAITPLLLGGSLASGEEEQAILDAFQRCHDRLTAEGNDLSAYHSAASAADIRDLALALGYPQINLYAVSYGTRLALTLLRDYPQTVRSAVLDSVYPLEVNLYTSLAPNAERAFQVFFQRCAADPACSAAYPDLKNVFYELVDQLNQVPLPIQLPVGGTEVPVLLDGGLLVDVLLVGLYNPAVAAQMPEMIFNIRGENYTILYERLRLYFDTETALGMQMAVQCAEEIPFSPIQEAYDLARDVQPQVAAFFPRSVQPLFTACPVWNDRALDPRENQPVQSEVPALILAGEQDPITPPQWGRQTASQLSAAYFYEFPGQGHWITRSSACALAMALSFWDQPGAAPNSSCIFQ